MPVETVVGVSSPRWAIDYQWPARYQQATGADPAATAFASGAPFLTGTIPTNIGRTLLSLQQGGGGVTVQGGYYNGLWRKRVVTVGAVPMDTWGYVNLYPAIGLAASFAPGTVTPEHMRAVWLQFTLAMDAGAVWTTASGVCVHNSAAPLAVSNWPGAGAQPNLGGFGIVGNGAANGLQFAAFDNVTPGPANILTTAPVPAVAAPGAWRSFDFFITGGSPSRDATLDVYVGGTLLAGATQLRFTNAAGGCWWDAAATSMMQLTWRLGDLGAGNGMHITALRFRTGSYTRDGAELTS